jgi:hydrogenase maturation factor HypE
MQVTINLEKSILETLKADFKTENIENAIYKLIHQYKNRKEIKMANDINQALFDVKNGNSNPIENLLNEPKKGN